MVVRDMLAAGAHALGVTKLSSMIGKEEATDYRSPFNRRGDGYQSPAWSCSGYLRLARFWPFEQIQQVLVGDQLL